MRHLALTATLLTLASCTTEPGRERVVGLIDTTPSAQALTAPDTVSVDVPVSVTVVTWGSACRSADGATVRVTNLLADITPYDRLPPAGTNCIQIVLPLPRAVSLRWATPGQGTIRLHGRYGSESVILERSITVLP
jgi:hypothetical protein